MDGLATGGGPAGAAEGAPVGLDRLGQMEAIVAEHETSLLRYATRIVNNPFLAQDVVQRVFIKLSRVWPEGSRPSPRLRSWLYAVTHNEAVDQVRRESREKILHEQAAEAQRAACEDGVHCAETAAARREQVLENLRRLDPAEQQVLLLRLEEGLSYAEIAEVTGRSEGNVGCLLHHAVRKLSKLVRQKQMSNSECRSPKAEEMKPEKSTTTSFLTPDPRNLTPLQR